MKNLDLRDAILMLRSSAGLAIILALTKVRGLLDKRDISDSDKRIAHREEGWYGRM